MNLNWTVSWSVFALNNLQDLHGGDHLHATAVEVVDTVQEDAVLHTADLLSTGTGAGLLLLTTVEIVFDVGDLIQAAIAAKVPVHPEEGIEVTHQPEILQKNNKTSFFT